MGATCPGRARPSIRPPRPPKEQRESQPRAGNIPRLAGWAMWAFGARELGRCRRPGSVPQPHGEAGRGTRRGAFLPRRAREVQSYRPAPAAPQPNQPPRDPRLPGLSHQGREPGRAPLWAVALSVGRGALKAKH